MNKKEFIRKVADCLRKDDRFSTCKIEITNDETALVITKETGENISRLVYSDSSIILSKPVAEAVDSLYQEFQKIHNEQKESINIVRTEILIPASSFAVEIVNYEENKNFLNRISYIRKYDFAAYVSCIFSNNGKIRTPMNQQLLNNLGITLEDAMEYGFDNIRSKVVAVLINQTGQRQPVPFSYLLDRHFDFNQYKYIMITTLNAEFGSSLLLDDLFLKIFSKRVVNKFYIIPGTRNEMIIYPTDYPKHVLKCILAEINEKAKASNPNLFVSDHVYVCENGVTNILI